MIGHIVYVLLLAHTQLTINTQAGKRVGNLRPDPTLGSRFGARPDPTIFGPRPDPTRPEPEKPEKP